MRGCRSGMHRPVERTGLKPEVGEAEEGGHIRMWMCGQCQLENWRRCDGKADGANGDDQRLGIRLIAQVRQFRDHRHVRLAELFAFTRRTGVGRAFARMDGNDIRRWRYGLVQSTRVRNSHEQRKKPHDERKARDGLALLAEQS